MALEGCSVAPFPGKLLEELSESGPGLVQAPCLCGPCGPALLVTAVSPPSISLSLEQQLDPPQKERLTAALAEMDQQLRKLADTPWLCQPMEPGDEEVCGSRASAWHPGRGAVPSVSESLCGFGVKMVLLLRPLIWPPVNTRLC